MLLLKKFTAPRDITDEQIKEVKNIYGIKRIPHYFSSLLWATHQMNLSDIEKQDLGIIYVSHLGPIHQVNKYINDLLTYPPNECSPAFFSHSVFNAPVAFLTKYMNVQGPSLSVCGFQQIIKASVLSAFSWLKTSYCSKVLIIYSDENVDISQKISDLTGLQLFQQNHIILLGSASKEMGENSLKPDHIIEMITNIYQPEGI